MQFTIYMKLKCIPTNNFHSLEVADITINWCPKCFKELHICTLKEFSLCCPKLLHACKVHLTRLNVVEYQTCLRFSLCHIDIRSYLTYKICNTNASLFCLLEILPLLILIVIFYCTALLFFYDVHFYILVW